MFPWTFHCLLRVLSVDLPKKNLRNTTWGVFKAYAVFFLWPSSEKIKPKCDMEVKKSKSEVMLGLHFS